MRFLLVLSALFLSISAVVAEDSLPQRYLAAYLKINEAERLAAKSDYAGAAQDFRDCRKMLLQIRTDDPAWESALVGHRVDDCRREIRDLDEKAADAAAVNPTGQAGVIKQVVVSPNDDDAIPSIPQGGRRSYPWKEKIITTLFWIGEDSSHASAWNENWTMSNHGADSPDARNGFSTATHASSVNPFYVALPFNDLAHPDKAHDWVPRSWIRPDVNGQPVSACKDRWVVIKTPNDRLCYAQWEDVGPNGNDHAEYIFGDDRPSKGNRAGLDVSPAVAQYLGIAGKDVVVTSWRFVDDQDVPPGQWLKYDEQAIIYTALHEIQKTGR